MAKNCVRITKTGHQDVFIFLQITKKESLNFFRMTKKGHQNKPIRHVECAGALGGVIDS